MTFDEFFPIRSVQTVFLVFAALSAYATARKRALSLCCIYGVAAWFLVFKISQYVGSGQLPMDISAICYFLFGISALLPVRPVKISVAQLCALCGLVYAVCMLSRPQIFYGRDPTEIGRYFAVVNHSLLLFGGLCVMIRYKFRRSDLFWTLLLLAAIIAYTEICVANGVQEGTAVFSQIVNGSIILLIVPGFTLAWWYYILYYMAVALLFGLWIFFTYALNRRAVSPENKCGFFAV